MAVTRREVLGALMAHVLAPHGWSPRAVYALAQPVVATRVWRSGDLERRPNLSSCTPT
jgi:hypothetical protein